MKNGLPEVTAFVILAINALLWRNILIYGVAASDVSTDVGVPMVLRVPSLRVKAPVEHVGLTSAGAMDVPKHTRDVGWFTLGPRPGQPGSATIDGHVNWMFGATAVFSKLHRLNSGALITVEDDKGVLTFFTVREIRIVDAAADTTDIFSSTDGKAHLNLITCGGAWDAKANQYSKRLIVFADKLGD